MVSGHLQIKKDTTMLFSAITIIGTSGTSSMYPQDFPRRETNEKRRLNSHESAMNLSRRRRWESFLLICLLQIICFSGWTL